MSKSLFDAVSPFISDDMRRHSGMFTPEARVALSIDSQNGYTLALTVQELRELHAAYNSEKQKRDYIRNRFYFRGATWLGVLNTALAWLCNRVLVKHIDADTRKIVGWSVKRGTDFPLIPARLDGKHVTIDPDELARLRRVADLARLFIVNSGNVMFTSENAHFDALRDEVIAQMGEERAAH